MELLTVCNCLDASALNWLYETRTQHISRGKQPKPDRIFAVVKKKTPTGHLYLLLFFVCALKKGKLNVKIHANECKGTNFKTFKQFIYFLRRFFFSKKNCSELSRVV